MGTAITPSTPPLAAGAGGEGGGEESMITCWKVPLRVGRSVSVHLVTPDDEPMTEEEWQRFLDGLAFIKVGLVAPSPQLEAAP